MASNGPERPRIVDLGPGASKTDVDAFIREWRARIAATKPSEDDYPCGGVLRVALAWFAAGVLVTVAAVAVMLIT